MTIPIDVAIREVGRIQLRTGTTDPKVARRIRDMVRMLPRMGYLEVVRDIASGQRTLLEVYGHYVNGTMQRLVGPSLDVPLLTAINTWLDGFAKSPEHVQSYRDALRYLNPGTKATLRDLPRILADYRIICEAKPRAFNLARSMTQAFVRDTMGKHKPLYLDVANVGSLREAKEGRRGLPIIQAIAVREQLSPKAARMWWSMCITGMNPKELRGKWEVLSDRVRIYGTKRIGRQVRDVPLIDYPTRPELTKWGLTTALRKLDMTPYQGRKTYGVWLDSIGLPDGRHDAYMGHGAETMRDLYSQPEVDSLLRDDAARLRAELPSAGLALVKS